MENQNKKVYKLWNGAKIEYNPESKFRVYRYTDCTGVSIDYFGSLPEHLPYFIPVDLDFCNKKRSKIN